MGKITNIDKTTPERPMSFSAVSEYREGWNACSEGAKLDDNPYRHDPASMSKWNQWSLGFADYLKSPFHCLAHLKYRLYGTRVAYYADDTDVFKVELLKEEDFEAKRYCYSDESSVVVTSRKLYIEGRDGQPFIERFHAEAANSD